MNSNKFKMTIGMAIIACVATWCYSNTKQEVSGVNEMVWANIEALAQNESGNYMCWDSGDIDCYGHKVFYKFEDFSLKRPNGE